MPNLTHHKNLLDTATRALGLGLALVYVIGLLITNIYFSRFGISDFSMLRVRYLTTGFAFLGFSLFPLIVLMIPILAFYFLRSRHLLLSVSASLVTFLMFACTAYMVLLFVVNERTITAPIFLYAAEVSVGADLFGEWLKILIKWFTPVALVLFVYAPLGAIIITWHIGKVQRTALVVCIPLLIFGTALVLARFAGGHYPQLRPAFGGPTAMVSDVVVEAAACSQLGVELKGDDKVCAIKGIKLLHETDKRIYLKLPESKESLLQIPLTHVRIIASPKLP